MRGGRFDTPGVSPYPPPTPSLRSGPRPAGTPGPSREALEPDPHARGLRGRSGGPPRALRGEERALARPALPGGGARVPHGLPARPRPRRPLARLPPPRVQDAGLRLPRGRSLPEPPHAHARGRPDLAHDRPSAAPQRGARGGGRAGARPRSHALRSRRRTRPRRPHAGRRRLRPQPPEPARGGPAGGPLPRLPRPEPLLRDARG